MTEVQPATSQWYVVAVIGVMFLASLLYFSWLGRVRCPKCQRTVWRVYGGLYTATFECKHCNLWHTCRHTDGVCVRSVTPDPGAER